MWRPSHPPATVAVHERKEAGVIVLRQVIGDELRRRRQDQGRTLRDVSAAVWSSTVPEHYHHVPTGFVVPWGQGPLLTAALAIERRGA